MRIERRKEAFRTWSFLYYSKFTLFRYPHAGCCNYEETLQLESTRKHDRPGKPISFRGLLEKKIPPPSAEAVELRTGEWRPIYERLGSAGNPKPTFVLFWTKWCRASIRLMDHLTQYAEEHGQDVS